MNPSSRSSPPGAAASCDAPAAVQEHAVTNMVETDRHQVLARSRQIVNAAYELLEQEGLEGLTIRAVLKRAGCSRRAFYERFAGKDDLILAVFEQTIRLATDHYSQLVSHLSDPLERLELIITSIGRGSASPEQVEDTREHRRGAALSREHLRLAESRPNDLQAALSPLIALIARELANGMEVGVIRRGDPQRLAVFVYNLVSTTVHSELMARENEKPDPDHSRRLAVDIWEFCRRAIIA